jgi:hypothetical protein
MDALADRSKSDGKRPGLFIAVMRAFRGVIRWLTGLFTLTEENLLKAGIYLGGEGRD